MADALVREPGTQLLQSIQRSTISAVALTDYRNYTAAKLELDGRHVVLTGPNGSGKTNLMEAVSLLAPGRGLRRATLSDLARNGAGDGFSIFTNVKLDDNDYAVGTGTLGQAGTAEGIGPSRRIRINGTACRSTEELMELTRIVWLTPAMDGLFTGAAGDRRRFLDRMVLAIDPAHARRSTDYEKSMRQRNRLLGDDRHGPQVDIMLDGIEQQMAALGTAIIAARQELVVHLSVLMANTAGHDSDFPTGIISLQGDYEALARTDVPAAEIEALFLQNLRTMRYRDRAAGRTLSGPHRADLVVFHRQKDSPAHQCSTGEQKALLLGLVLAHAELTRNIAGMTPILLLDEIAAHLDAGRRAALFDRIDALGGQSFMTGTDRSLFDAMDDRAQRFHVADGTVMPECAAP